MAEWDSSSGKDVRHGAGTMRWTESNKLYFSYYYKHKSNTFFPCHTVSARDEFGTISSAKLNWLEYNDNSNPAFSNDQNDLNLLSFNGAS